MREKVKGCSTHGEPRHDESAPTRTFVTTVHSIGVAYLVAEDCCTVTLALRRGHASARAYVRLRIVIYGDSLVNYDENPLDSVNGVPSFLLFPRPRSFQTFYGRPIEFHVAVPSLKADLERSRCNYVWVVKSYGGSPFKERKLVQLVIFNRGTVLESFLRTCRTSTRRSKRALIEIRILGTG